MEWIRVADDGRSFVGQASGKPMVPWGFNYDRDYKSRLLEDYWGAEWPAVVRHFREMKALGANVVRVHLQFARFMDAPAAPNARALQQLGRLLALAEETGLYLDLTGLGCYHKKDVPAWYDAMDERARWDAQAAFWAAVSARCAASPAVFCYDLMNEPVVPGRGKRTDWLGLPLGDEYFVQFITLDLGERARPDVAAAWVRHLKAAIRRHDQRHLITVGLVPWSLDRPGLSSGFVPEKIAGDLDFVCVHLYPNEKKPDEDLKTLAGFAAVGKPVVIEEIFPLSCGVEHLRKFIVASRQQACGWIGFFWGQTPEELTPPKTIPEAMTLEWLKFFRQGLPTK
jgi:hypothetical protein